MHMSGFKADTTKVWFAWSANYNSVHWAVPTVAGTFLSTSCVLMFVVSQVEAWVQIARS